MTYAASIETSILGTDNAKAILLSVKVLLKNVGNPDASVTNDEQAIRVARVHFADNTIAALIDPVYSGFYLVSEPHKERGMLKIGSVALLANQTKELTGLVSIAHDGLYTANFVGRRARISTPRWNSRFPKTNAPSGCSLPQMPISTWAAALLNPKI